MTGKSLEQMQDGVRSMFAIDLTGLATLSFFGRNGMKIFSCLCLVIFLSIFTGCVTQPRTATQMTRRGWSCNERFDYRSEEYITAAFRLQALDHKAAAQLLMFMARSSPSDGDAVFILCRMLFTNRPAAQFRRPMIGGGQFFGDTDYADWPLEPIEIVDGVPFLISRRGLLAGFAEPNTSYLQYCLQECDRNNFRFTPKTAGQKAAALNKLLASPKWRRPLNESERKFLADQIQ